jgi:hypothetical protein
MPIVLEHPVEGCSPAFELQGWKAVKPILISYPSKHRDSTRGLVDAIEAQFGAESVWWDRALENRGSYFEEITTALEKARVVVLIGAVGAMSSDYVYADGRLRAGPGTLGNVLPADTSFQGPGSS